LPLISYSSGDFDGLGSGQAIPFPEGGSNLKLALRSNVSDKKVGIGSRGRGFRFVILLTAANRESDDYNK
jgi:hypothetical protein